MNEDAEEKIRQLFSQESVIVPKRTKNGMQDQNIIPMIRRLQVNKKNDNLLVLDCVVCCQNPTLNPMQLCAAIERYLPAYVPSFSKCIRMEVLDEQEKVFR